MRDEGEHVLEAITEAVTVGREAGMPVQLSHFKIDNRRLWGGSDQSLALVERYRRDGVDVVVDQYPYDRSSTNLGIRLPTWALAEGKVKERLADPATRKRIADEMVKDLANNGQPDYSFCMVARFAANQKYEGKNISEINAMEGRAPGVANEIETIFSIMSQGGAQMIYHEMGDLDVERIMRYPFTAVASDGGIIDMGVGMPHPRAYGTNARVLAEYVRTRGTLTLEDAVRRMTSLPARTFGFRDRGLVREGLAADLVLFDLARVRDRATFAKPHQTSEGFDLVIVNGKAVVEDGKVTGIRAGKTLKH
jgi:N-acyl-D-amino-acid deacylase